jgi:phosphatidate cytidylyltransferase
LPRKLLIRVIGAPLLLAALGAILYWGHRRTEAGLPNTPLTVLILLVLFLSILEFWAMCRGKGIGMPNPYLLTLVTFAGVWGLTRLQGGETPQGLEAAFVTLLLLVLLVFRFGKVTPEGVAFSLLGFAYLGLIGFLLMTPVPAALSTFYLLFLLACSKGSDMAAFVVGKSIGKHPMAPVVSPNKTWEGGIGGGLAGTAAGFAVIWLTPLKTVYSAVPVPALLGLALLVTIAAQVGDLVKSAFKRWAGVKDSGRLLPEFGGMIDMVDSFLVAGPVSHFATILLWRAFA